jgi:hypothetical protein
MYDSDLNMLLEWYLTLRLLKKRTKKAKVEPVAYFLWNRVLCHMATTSFNRIDLKQKLKAIVKLFIVFIYIKIVKANI